MTKRNLIVAVLTLAAIPLFFNAHAGAVGEDAGTTAGQAQEQIYGSQLMTPEERAEHRARMRAATTAEERDQIRAEHHALMQERAKQRGITLPEEPPERGMGAGPGPGPGKGYGGGRGQ